MTFSPLPPLCLVIELFSRCRCGVYGVDMSFLEGV